MSGLRSGGIYQVTKGGEVPGDYIAKESIVVGDERGLEFSLCFGEVGESWYCHGGGSGFFGGGIGFILERADESTHC